MKMNTWRKLLAVCVSFVLLSAFGFAFSACSKDNGKNVTPGPETGMYFYDADDGDTYYITLSDGDSVSMQVRGETVTGSYVLEGTAFTFTLNTEKEVSATYSEDAIALTYEGAQMRFLRIVSYTVSFDTNGGSAIEDVKVMNGRTVSKPADPVKDGYAFIGWFADAEFKSAFAFDAAPVTKDTVLYARWSDKLNGSAVYTVDFDLNYNGAEELEAVQTVGGKLYEVPTPVREGYEFCGWWVSDYESADKLTYLYEGGAFEANTTLFALWESEASEKISAPVPSVKGDSVVWKAVEGASIYEVEITGPNGITLVSERTGATSVSANFSSSAAGDYVISVRAVAAVEANSSDVVYRYFNNKALARVSVFEVIEPSILLFTGVKGAEKYKITVVCGNLEHKHTDFDNGLSTYFDFSKCDMKEGGIAFTVTAYATGRAPSVSETFYYDRVLDKIESFYFDEETETVSWNAIPNAADYKVKVTAGESVYELSTEGKTAVSLKNYAFSEIKVEVVPVTIGYNSPASSEYTYTRSRLSAPAGLTVSGTVLKWNAVSGAQSYTVMVDGREYKGIEKAEFELSEVSLTNGVDYEIFVMAVGTENSVWSDPLSVQYYSLSSSIIYAKNTVYWHHVVGAASYNVKVNDEEAITVTAGTVSAPVKLTKAGENVISIRFVDSANAAGEWVSVSVYAYTVAFDTREGTAVEPLYVAKGDIVTLPVTTRDGFDLNGWYDVPGAAQVNGAKFADGSAFSATGDIILYANWSPKPYTVNYEVSEGEVDRTSDSVVYTSDYRLAVPTNEDTSRTFVGWYEKPNGQGVQFTDSEGYSLSPWNFKEDKTVYPYWISIFEFSLQTQGTYNDTYSVVVTPEASHVSKVVIPETYNGKSVTIVEGYAFHRYSTLKTIEIPDTIKIIYYDSAFEGCTALEAINIYETGNAPAPLYSSDNGVLFYTSEVAEEGKALVYIPEGLTGHYTIPDDVKSVNQNAFTNSKLTSVTIPSSVNYIATQAFSGNSHLTEIYFNLDAGDELIVESGAFEGCTALKSLTIPARFKQFDPSVIGGSNVFENIYVAEDHEIYSSVNGMLCNKAGDEIVYCPPARRGALRIPTGIRSIGAGAFSGCNNLTGVIIPNFVKSVGDGAFSGCTKLTSVTFAGGNALGDELTLGERVFSSCSSLARVVFEENSNVTALGDNVFEGCSKITSFTLSDTIKDLSAGVFSGCANLVYVYVDEDNPYFFAENGVLFDKAQTRIIYYSNNLSETVYVLPETVKTIDPYVFSGNVALQKIVIGNQIENIGEKAFYNCSNLSSVVFVDGGSTGFTIGASAFEGCGSLKNIYVASSATSEESTYTKGTPATLRVIGEKAFSASALSEVVFGEGLEEIGGDAFVNCDSLSSVSLPASLKVIGDRAFSRDMGLAEVILASNSMLQTIGELAFADCPIPSFTVPKTVEFIEASAFDGADLSEGFFFEEGRTVEVWLGVNLFRSTNLTSITFPDLCVFNYDDSKGFLETPIDGAGKLTEINNMPANDKYAFIDGIFYVLKGGVPATLDHAIFSDAEYVVPNTVTLVLNGAFYGCSGSTVSFEAGGTADLAIQGGAFNNSGVVGVAFPARLKQLGEEMFSFSQVASVTFEDTDENPSRLEEIPTNAFANMDYLQSIEIPRSVKRIGDMAFAPNWFGDVALSEIILHEGLEYIGDYAFSNDSGMGSLITELTIPASVKYIGSCAFSNSKNLSTLTIAEGSELQILGAGAFSFTAITSVTIPATLAGSAYKEQESGSQAPDGKLGDYLFMGCNKLSSVTFEDGCPLITAYGSGVFEGCTSYSYVDFPVNLQKIESWGSSGGAIKSITIPNFFDEATFSGFVPSLTGVLHFEMEENNPYLYQDGENGAIYSSDKTRLLYYPNCYTAETYKVLDSTTEIGDRAFFENQYLQKVILNEGLKKIGNYAFGVSTSTHSTALTEISIPSTVESIGDRAFFGCDHLKTLTFVGASDGSSALTKIGSSAFRHCTSLVSVDIPDSVTQLGMNVSIWEFTDPDQTASVFYECTSLESVALPNNLTDLQSLVFGKCTSLKTVIFKEGSTLQRISPNAFAGCGVVSLDFTNAKNLTEIGDYAFSNCGSLESLTFGTTSQFTVGAYAFENSSLQSVVLPSNLLSVGDYAFFNTETLTSVTVADGSLLSSIGAGAFRNTAITSFAFDKTPLLETIGDYAFYETKLTEIALSEKVSYVGDYAFYGCEEVTSLTLSEAVSYIGNYAFAKMPLITEVHIFGNNTTVGTGAFEDCFALESVTLESGVESLGNFAFGFTAITSITLPDTLTSLDGNPFAGCAINNIEILSTTADLVFDEVNKTLLNADKTLLYYTTSTATGEYVLDSKITAIMPGAFAGSSIKSIAIPDNFTTIADGTFRNCTELESITIGKNITSIGIAAFEGCTSLKTVTFEKGGTQVLNIGERAFKDCTSLENVEFPDRLRDHVDVKIEIIDLGFEQIEVEVRTGTPGIGESSFENSGLKTISYEKNVSSEINTGAYDTETLAIGPSAFRNCLNLVSAEFGSQMSGGQYDEGVAEFVVCDYAFYGCEKLASISLTPDPETGFMYLSSIGQYAFANCAALTSFTVPNKLSNFLEYSFSGSGLTSMELPAYTDDFMGDLIQYTIKEGAFSYCEKLETFACHGEMGMLNGSFSQAELGAYAFKGCTALTSVEFDDVYAVMDGAFEDCTALKSVNMVFKYKNIITDLSDSTLLVGIGAFKNCSALSSVNITGDLQSIEANAFEGCVSLMSITIPDKVVSVSATAFYGWTSNQKIVVPFADADSVLSGWNPGWSAGATVVYGAAA